MYTYNISKKLCQILNTEFDQTKLASDQELEIIPEDAILALHGTNFLRKHNPMKDSKIAKIHMENKMTNGFSQSQSKVAKERNKQYWSNPENRKKLSEKNLLRVRKSPPQYKVSNAELCNFYYSLNEISKAIDQPQSTIYKYMKIGKRFSSGWLVEKVQVDSVSKSNLQNSDQAASARS